jgi:hypothetical protein
MFFSLCCVPYEVGPKSELEAICLVESAPWSNEYVEAILNKTIVIIIYTNI